MYQQENAKGVSNQDSLIGQKATRKVAILIKVWAAQVLTKFLKILPVCLIAYRVASLTKLASHTSIHAVTDM